VGPRITLSPPIPRFVLRPLSPPPRDLRCPRPLGAPQPSPFHSPPAPPLLHSCSRLLHGICRPSIACACANATPDAPRPRHAHGHVCHHTTGVGWGAVLGGACRSALSSPTCRCTASPPPAARPPTCTPRGMCACGTVESGGGGEDDGSGDSGGSDGVRGRQCHQLADSRGVLAPALECRATVLTHSVGRGTLHEEQLSARLRQSRWCFYPAVGGPAAVAVCCLCRLGFGSRYGRAGLPHPRRWCCCGCHAGCAPL
jgi:hypothetical protein